MPVRRIVALFTAALLAAGLGYTAYWFHTAGQLRKQLDAWAGRQRGQGWQVEWETAETSGFPLHLRLELTAPHLSNPSGVDWRAEHVVAHAQPFDWTRIRAESPGRHRVVWPGGSVTIDAGAARADINLDRAGTLEDATLLASALTVSGLAAEPMTAAGLALTWDPLPVVRADHTVATLRFSATAHDVVLPPLPGLPLDRAVGLAEITGRVMGAIPDAPLAQAIGRWSADGGIVELDHVSLEWAPVALEAQGTLALDPAGQPLGSLITRMRGFGPLMDRLAEAGTLPADTANAAKMVLLLMAKPDAKGRPSVPVPVSLQDGALYLGPARVARVPAINWR